MVKGKEMVEDKENIDVMIPPALGERQDGGRQEGIEPIEDETKVEVMKPPALGERWDVEGRIGESWSRTRRTWRL